MNLLFILLHSATFVCLLKVDIAINDYCRIPRQTSNFLISAALNHSSNYVQIERLTLSLGCGLRDTLKSICQSLTPSQFKNIRTHVLENIHQRHSIFLPPSCLSMLFRMDKINEEDLEGLVLSNYGAHVLHLPKVYSLFDTPVVDPLLLQDCCSINRLLEDQVQFILDQHSTNTLLRGYSFSHLGRNALLYSVNATDALEILRQYTLLNWDNEDIIAFCTEYSIRILNHTPKANILDAFNLLKCVMTEIEGSNLSRIFANLMNHALKRFTELSTSFTSDLIKYNTHFSPNTISLLCYIANHKRDTTFIKQLLENVIVKIQSSHSFCSSVKSLPRLTLPEYEYIIENHLFVQRLLHCHPRSLGKDVKMEQLLNQTNLNKYHFRWLMRQNDYTWSDLQTARNPRDFNLHLMSIASIDSIKYKTTLPSTISGIPICKMLKTSFNLAKKSSFVFRFEHSNGVVWLKSKSKIPLAPNTRDRLLVDLIILSELNCPGQVGNFAISEDVVEMFGRERKISLWAKRLSASLCWHRRLIYSSSCKCV